MATIEVLQLSHGHLISRRFVFDHGKWCRQRASGDEVKVLQGSCGWSAYPKSTSGQIRTPRTTLEDEGRKMLVSNLLPGEVSLALRADWRRSRFSQTDVNSQSSSLRIMCIYVRGLVCGGIRHVFQLFLENGIERAGLFRLRIRLLLALFPLYSLLGDLFEADVVPYDLDDTSLFTSSPFSMLRVSMSSTVPCQWPA